jgi:EmrB/QacA subfamily drug resistance transporter
LGWHRLLVEPRRPAAVRRCRGGPWLAVAAVCIGAFMGQLDASIVSLALPTLRSDFHSSLATVSWVGQAYLLVLVAMLPVVGRLADHLGRKLLYTYGFVVFALGSLACALAPDLAVLIACRAMQGIGAAMLQAISVAIVVGVAPWGKRGRALGIQGGAQALGLALGPAVGGLLIGIGGWRGIFWVNVIVGVLGAALGWALIPRSQNLAPATRFDWAGLATLAPAAAAAMFALSAASRSGWLSIPVGTATVVTVIATVLLARVERRASSPLLDPRLLAQRPVRDGMAAGLGAAAVLFATLTVMPFYLQEARHLSVGATGLLVLALPVGVGLVAPLSGRMAERIGTRCCSVTGLTVTALCQAGLLVAAHAGRPPTLELALLLLGVGAGLGAFTPANNAAVMASSPTTAASGAGGLINMARGFGTSLGLGLVGSFYGTARASGAGATQGLERTATALLLITVLCARLAWTAAPNGKGAPERGR